MKRINMAGFVTCLLLAAVIFPAQLKAQALKENSALDEKVKKFLSDNG